MSRDREIIEELANRNRLLHDIIAKSGIDLGRSKVAGDFDLVARAMNGERSARFGALRVLVRRFTRDGAYELLLRASEQSHQDWHLTITLRRDANRPDGGKRRRRSDHEFTVNQVGLAYYRFRREGLTNSQSLVRTSKHLRLNLTPRTILAKVQEFRKAAARRGYVDPYAPLAIGSLLSKKIREPALKVEELTKKGRPSKKVQSPKERTVLLPPLARR